MCLLRVRGEVERTSNVETVTTENGRMTNQRGEMRLPGVPSECK